MKTKLQRNCLRLGILCWLLLALLMLNGCFTGWSKKDKALFGSLGVLNAYDGYQTFGFIDEGRELNPLLQSKTGTVIFKLVGQGVIYLVVDSWPEYRTEVLGFSNGALGSLILRNFTVD